ncbi:MAG: cysteine desulfurase [Dinghuibacter sp.]|nr:cysteine desulfurase [Dinghuibacter sp.]
MHELQLPVYLDYNATTPADPRVVQAMLPWFTQQFGNASATGYPYGRRAAEAVQEAREQTAALIQAEPGEIVFTGSATESINLAIKGVFETYRNKGNHIIVSAIEHSAVLATCAALEKKGAEITVVPVGPDGRVNAADVEQAIRPATIMACLMYANNETGVIQPVQEVGEIAQRHNIFFFCDAVQAVGKIPVNVQECGIHLLALSAHKIYGPKGVGALYIRRKNPRVQPEPQIHGGQQENGRRSGTLNVPGIVGLGRAAMLCAEEMAAEALRLTGLRNGLEAMLEQQGALVNGNRAFRLPQVTSIVFPGIAYRQLAAALYTTVSASAGSACATGQNRPSHVLTAMGISEAQALGTLRLSVGRFTTQEEVQLAANAIIEAVKTLRAGN